MMLGVYDYTVVLTYVSVLISMGGMLFSMNGLSEDGDCLSGTVRILRYV